MPSGTARVINAVRSRVRHNVLERRKAPARFATLLRSGSQHNPESAEAVQGRVISAQHAYLRVRIQLHEMPADAFEERSQQLHAAATRAREAGDDERVQSLNARRACVSGALEVLCRARSLLRKVGGRVLVGDWVVLRGIDWVEQRGVVADVYPRSRFSTQPPVANFDQVLVVCALTQPEIDPWQLTKFLVSAEHTGAAVVPVLTKTDVCQDAAYVDEWSSRIQRWGYHSIVTSSVATGQGIAHIEHILRNRVSVLVGPSGAGKSSIINRIKLDALQHQRIDFAFSTGRNTPENIIATEAQMRDDAQNELSTLEDALPEGISATSSVRGAGGAKDEGVADSQGQLQSVRKVSRSGTGRHTTRNVDLLAMPQGGYLADTPGFGLPDVAAEADPEDVQWLFPELREQLEATGGTTGALCAFKDCSHRHEPGCGIKSDTFERYEYYTNILAEVEEAAKTRSKRRTQDAATRVKTKRGGQPETEARLSKKHHKRMSKRKQRQKVQEQIGLDEDEQWAAP